MAKRCSITGRGAQVGNNVSHANNKNKRRFLPNLQNQSLVSESTGETVRLRLSMKGLRTVEHAGGLDAYLMGTAPSKLSPELRRLRKRVEAAQVANA